jgi:hypothetical protein
MVMGRQAPGFKWSPTVRQAASSPGHGPWGPRFIRLSSSGCRLVSPVMAHEPVLGQLLSCTWYKHIPDVAPMLL